MPPAPFRPINAVAPTRVCDIGGWTDTWFAGHGAVFNVAIYPYVEVQVLPISRAPEGGRVVISVENYGETYAIDPDHVVYDKHPLIEAAVGAIGLPKGTGFRINIFSDVPPGASTGTSAAVSVALVGALGAMARGRLTPHEVASLAHSIETEKLGLQCGIQDQLASAYGGINFIEMHAFPRASVSPVHVPNSTWWELEQRLSVVYIGTPHSSSDIHKKVIAGLGKDPSGDARLQRMRELAREAKDALGTGDFAALGRAMDENTGVQRRLHPDLVCPRFEEIIATARDFGVLGAKVNGAGGDGGSITLLSDGDMLRKRKMLRVLEEKSYRHLPLYLARQGLRVW
jgi:D-glycero-alpha-D-manno-heptose-7-phosphate kinase